MRKISFYLTSVLMLAIFTGCGSGSDVRATAAPQVRTDDTAVNSSEAVSTDRALYLRGEMNDYGVSQTYSLKNHGRALCTFAMLRADWSPYKFKFADENWSAGTNFGYAAPPGVLRLGSAPVKLNPQSRFEELVFHVKEDGVYRFCLIRKSDGFYADVQETSEEQVPQLAGSQGSR